MSTTLSKAKRDARNSLADLVEAAEDILANRVEYLDESAEQAARELMESLEAVFRLHRANVDPTPARRTSRRAPLTGDDAR